MNRKTHFSGPSLSIFEALAPGPLCCAVLCLVVLLLLLSRFCRVLLCETPEMAAHQAPPSLGLPDGKSRLIGKDPDDGKD